jgi:hypothetical protein
MRLPTRRAAVRTLIVTGVIALASLASACGDAPRFAPPATVTPPPPLAAAPDAPAAANSGVPSPQSTGAAHAATPGDAAQGGVAPAPIPTPTSTPAILRGEARETASGGASLRDPGHAPAGAGSAATSNDVAAGDGVVALATPDVRIPAHETLVALPTPTATPQPSGAPTLAGCAMFPANNAWNQDISAMPVDANSAAYITRINQSGNGFLHADFGGNGAYGIPYIVVPQSQQMTAINFTDYGDESDPGPYPIPLNAPVEGGAASDGDRHVLAIQQGTCKLYELFYAWPMSNRWDASSGAVFDLSSNALRPQTWTSADAAGLPILPGLVRYDEVQAGAINHAVRFTVGTVRKAWVDPATHYGTSTDPLRIPYGAKLRLKASYDISGYDGQARVILNALKKYGMIVADQGTSWYITGAADARWDDDDLNQLKSVPGSAFEVVQLGTIHTYP